MIQIMDSNHFIDLNSVAYFSYKVTNVEETHIYIVDDKKYVTSKDMRVVNSRYLHDESIDMYNILSYIIKHKKRPTTYQETDLHLPEFEQAMNKKDNLIKIDMYEQLCSRFPDSIICTSTLLLNWIDKSGNSFTKEILLPYQQEKIEKYIVNLFKQSQGLLYG